MRFSTSRACSGSSQKSGSRRSWLSSSIVVRRSATSKIAPERVDALDEGFQFALGILLHEVRRVE
jgi:hypothetical protein